MTNHFLLNDKSFFLVLWEGQGNRLRTEICSNNRVKKFLDAVPYVMVCNHSKQSNLRSEIIEIDINLVPYRM